MHLSRILVALGAIALVSEVTACSSDDPGGPAAPRESASELELPGPVFYPTTIDSASDGTLFVGGAGTGEVVKFAAGSIEGEVIVPSSTPPIVIPGLIVHDSSETLFVCTDRFAPGFTEPQAELRRYDFDGNLQNAYPLPEQGTSLCEDLAVDSEHNVYISDSFNGVVYRLDQTTGTIRAWASSELLLPGAAPVPPFGAHGLTFDGAGNLYVDNFSTSTLVRVPINSDGSAGAAVAITVSPPITNPEALRALDAQHLLVVEDIWGSPDGRLTEITLAGDDTATSTVLRSGLRGPTSVAIADGSYWITEGQISNLIAGTTPTVPFLVLRQLAQ